MGKKTYINLISKQDDDVVLDSCRHARIILFILLRFSFILPTTETKVVEVVRKIKLKSSDEWDDNQALHQSNSKTTLAHIFNTSFSSGTFSDKFKLVLVNLCFPTICSMYKKSLLLPYLFRSFEMTCDINEIALSTLISHQPAQKNTFSAISRLFWVNGYPTRRQ